MIRLALILIALLAIFVRLPSESHARHMHTQIQRAIAAGLCTDTTDCINNGYHE